MDYGRFIELLGRFFERAGTVLHMKGEHYADEDGSPACVIIDQSRNTYYITEIGLPPEIPATDDILHNAINEYSNKHDIDPFVLRLFTVLGEDIKTSRFRELDDTGLDISSLQKKSALVVIDEKVPDVTAYAESLGLEYQTVPLKGIFTIYFFAQSASDEIEALYNKVSDLDETYLEPEQPTSPAEPEDADSIDAAEPVEDNEDDIEEDLNIEPEEPAATAVALPAEKAAPESVKDDNFFTALAAVAKAVYSFFFFAPAFLINKITKGRVPEGPAYFFGAVCAFLGLYYYPVKVGLAGFNGAMRNYAGDIIELSMNAFANLSAGIGALLPAPVLSVLDTANALAVYLLSFSIVILDFVNSHYYLQYMIVFAFLLAVIPAFRTFGRRVIAFGIIFYVLYVPACIIGHWAVSMNLSLIAMPQSYGAEMMLSLAKYTGGTLAISLMIPVLTAVISIKLCRGIKNGL